MNEWMNKVNALMWMNQLMNEWMNEWLNERVNDVLFWMALNSIKKSQEAIH